MAHVRAKDVPPGTPQHHHSVPLDDTHKYWFHTALEDKPLFILTLALVAALLFGTAYTMDRQVHLTKADIAHGIEFSYHPVSRAESLSILTGIAVPAPAERCIDPNCGTCLCNPYGGHCYCVYGEKDKAPK